MKFDPLNLQVCPAGERCLNQAFTKRQYSQVEIFRTLSRGWGLRCVHDIKKVPALLPFIALVYLLVPLLLLDLVNQQNCLLIS